MTRLSSEEKKLQRGEHIPPKRQNPIVVFAVYQLLFLLVFLGLKRMPQMDMAVKTVILVILTIISVFLLVMAQRSSQKSGELRFNNILVLLAFVVTLDVIASCITGDL